ncbi:potassium-transporting ATPase subunit F [Radicibacter daui]
MIAALYALAALAIAFYLVAALLRPEKF